jgi:hypothetical protein
MQTIDTTSSSVPTQPTRPAATRRIIGETGCTRPPSWVPPRRFARAFTTGQLARDDYVRAATEARTSGMWL